MLSAKETGLPCPNCSSFIHVSLTQLIARQPLVCPNCDTILRMDAAKSKDGLDAIEKIKQAQEKGMGKGGIGNPTPGYSITSNRNQ